MQGNLIFFFIFPIIFGISCNFSPVSAGDNLHEMSYLISWEKNKKKYFNTLSAEIFTQHTKHKPLKQQVKIVADDILKFFIFIRK